jgi:hypothetical protein
MDKKTIGSIVYYAIMFASIGFALGTLISGVLTIRDVTKQIGSGTHEVVVVGYDEHQHPNKWELRKVE